MVIVKRIMVIVKEDHGHRQRIICKKVYHTWFAGSKHALVISATLNDSWYAFSDPITGAYVTNGKWILKTIFDCWFVIYFVNSEGNSINHGCSPPPKSNVHLG